METKERILDSAEQSFAKQGFEATSLRSITAAAQVNLAAVNYHFGSKESLLAAIIERRATPLNADRLRELERLEAGAGDGPLAIEAILRAFLEPLIRIKRELGTRWESVMQIAQQMHDHPDERLRSLVLSSFVPTARRFISAIQRSLPEIPPGEVAMRFYFVVGAMIHTLTWEQKSSILQKEGFPSLSIEEVMERLVHFATAGMLQGSFPAAGKGEGGGS
jgi:AcrR family transcriptional regulator